MGYATRLGDVTTPTGGGSGVFSQIYSWFTGSTANAANSPQIVQDWMIAVRSRGNAVVRYPRTDDIGTAGDLAERESNIDPDTGAVLGYSYYMAPDDVINADRVTRGLSKLAPATAVVADAGERLLKVASGVNLDLTKSLLTIGVALVAVNALVNSFTRRR